MSAFRIYIIGPDSGNKFNITHNEKISRDSQAELLIYNSSELNYDIDADLIILDLDFLAHSEGNNYEEILTVVKTNKPFILAYSETKAKLPENLKEKIHLVISDRESMSEFMEGLQILLKLKKLCSQLFDHRIFLERLSDLSGRGLCLLGKDLNIIKLNTNFLNILGYENSDTYLNNAKQFIDENNFFNFNEHFTGAVTDDSESFMLTFKNRNGSKKVASTKMIPLTKDDSGINYVLLSVENSTQGIDRGIEMKENESKIFNNAPVAMWYTDTQEFRAIGVNESAAKLFGLSKETFIGKKLTELIPVKTVSAAQLIISSETDKEISLDDVSFRYRDKEFTTHLKMILTRYEHQRACLVILNTQSDKTETSADQEHNKPEPVFQKILDSIKEIIIRMDPDGRIIFINKSWEVVTGISSGNLIGLHILDILSPSTDSSSLNSIKRILTSKTGNCSEVVNIEFKNGESGQFELLLNAVTENTGRFTGFAGILNNITDQIRSRSEAQEHFTKFKELFESSYDAIFLIKAGRVIDCNKSACKLFKTDPEHFRNTSPFEISPFLQPGDNKSDELIKKYFDSSLDGKSQKFEWQFLRSDKKGFLAEVSMKSMKINNETLTQVVLKDITLQKEAGELLKKSEQKFKSLIQHSTDIFTKLDANGMIIFTSPSVQRILGYEPFELEGQVAFDFVHPDDSQRVVNYFFESLGKEGIVAPIDYRIKCKDGSYVHLESVANNKLNDENVEAIIVTSRDITDRKHSEELMLRAKNEAQEMNRLKSNFLANMSHELRTPLVGILGFAELLNEEVVDSEQKDMTKTILHSGQRLLHTLNSILDLSKIEANSIEIKNNKIDVVATVKSAVKIFRKLAVKQGIYLRVESDESTIDSILDERLLTQIIGNLVSNGIKYTSNGGVTIKILKEHKEKNDWVIIKVSDTGIGIPAESYEMIFQEFRQVSEGFSRMYEGVGLGLTITKRFVELMGGTISVESQIGYGSTFTIAFKMLSQKDPNEFYLPELSLPYPEKNNAESTNEDAVMRILLVENDSLSINVIKTFLKDICQIDVAESGELAIQMTSENRYDGVLLDIDLGEGINGIEVLNAIRKIEYCKNIPVVAVTAYAMKGDKERFLEAGCTDYISKPFVKKRLIDSVEMIKINRRLNIKK